MPKRVIEVPEGLDNFADAVEAMLKRREEFSKLAKKDGAPVDFKAFSEGLAESAAGAQLSLIRRSLQELDVDCQRVEINGNAYARVGRYEATYCAKQGPVAVVRSLYRRCGERNAKTVDAVTLRSGAVDGWLPDAASAAAFLLQQGTSREAEATARALGVLPYSRSSFERVGHKIGELHAVMRAEVENVLLQSFRLPRDARSMSISIDRVAVPMEEPRARPPGRPKAGAPKRPVNRVWHMAFVGTLTLHDARGEALHTIRYGRMPGLGASGLLNSLAADAKKLLKKRPTLHVVLLCDGAKELVDLLDRAFNRETLGVEVHRLVDFWHVAEKLGAAASVMVGAAASETLHRWKGLLLNSDRALAKILNELYASPNRDLNVGEERPVRAAITYLQNQGARMGFSAARARGLPVGSGNVEATCKSLIGQRLVRSGSRWQEATGQHVIDLRALALSNRFDAAIALTLAPLQTQVRAAA